MFLKYKKSRLLIKQKIQSQRNGKTEHLENIFYFKSHWEESLPAQSMTKLQISRKKHRHTPETPTLRHALPHSHRRVCMEGLGQMKIKKWKLMSSLKVLHTCTHGLTS